MKERERKYWIITASKDGVKNAVVKGIAQACHGKPAPLRRLVKGDFVIYYSSRQTLDKPEKCQEFTALGRGMDNATYQVQVSEDFCPSRRNIKFLPSKDTSILPLIDDLKFISNKRRWGYPFRFGLLEINRRDFDLISSKMLQNQYETENTI